MTERPRPIRDAEGLRLFQGDASRVLSGLPKASIDMAYSDPPFGNMQDWTGSAGSFSDKWKPGPESARGWEALAQHSPDGAMMVGAATAGLSGSMRAYIGTMACLVVAVHRVLKPTGTFWLHFDDTAGAHLRILCEAVFGPGAEVGSLVWRRTAGAKSNVKGFGRVHDTIACYARSEAAKWRLWRFGTVGGDPISGEGWPPRFAAFAEAAPLNQASRERVGYPTQKPIALLKELIRAATRQGDLILDPTMGSGTTILAAINLGRRAIGIDLSQDALRAAEARLCLTSAQPSFSLGASA